MNLHKTYQSPILSYSIADGWANYNYYYRCGLPVLIPNLLEIVGETGCAHRYFSCNLYQIGYNNLNSCIFY